MIKRLVLLTAAANAATSLLPEKLRTDIAMVQRDIREVERNYYNLRIQYEEQTKGIMEKGKELGDKMLTLKKQAVDLCSKNGMDFDEQKLECRDKQNERNNK